MHTSVFRPIEAEGGVSNASLTVADPPVCFAKVAGHPCQQPGGTTFVQFARKRCRSNMSLCVNSSERSIPVHD